MACNGSINNFAGPNAHAHVRERAEQHRAGTGSRRVDLLFPLRPDSAFDRRRSPERGSARATGNCGTMNFFSVNYFTLRNSSYCRTLSDVAPALHPRRMRFLCA